ncbi:MAG: DUF2752 domain-containing protein [Puniceicoccales bacterium]|nr:DUF2752 domain-containing protein [Puniceicoccales bacterium]
MRISRRPLLPGEVDFERWLAWLIPAAWLLAWLLLFVLPVRLPPCLLYHYAGIPCPGCGSSRATVSLAHGDILAALNFNPMWTVICLSGIVAWGFSLATLALGKLRYRCGIISPAEGWIFRIGFLLILLFNWAWVLWREYTHQ